MALGRESGLPIIPVFLNQLAPRLAPSFLFTQQLGEGSPEVDNQRVQRTKMEGFGKAAFAFEPIDQFRYTDFSLERIFSLP